MVTKPGCYVFSFCFSLILAKIHMVTKRTAIQNALSVRLILAKIHMVTKQKQLYP